MRSLPPLPLYSGGEGGVRGDRLPCWRITCCVGRQPPSPLPLSPRVQGERGKMCNKNRMNAPFCFHLPRSEVRRAALAQARPPHPNPLLRVRGRGRTFNALTARLAIVVLRKV